MKFFFHWGCLLIFALVAPIALPAGGANRKRTEVVYSKGKELCYAGDSCSLKSSPYITSSPLRTIQLGTPLKVIRAWQDENGKNWLQVKLSTFELINLPNSSANRGWINV